MRFGISSPRLLHGLFPGLLPLQLFRLPGEPMRLSLFRSRFKLVKNLTQFGFKASSRPVVPLASSGELAREPYLQMRVPLSHGQGILVTGHHDAHLALASLIGRLGLPNQMPPTYCLIDQGLNDSKGTRHRLPRDVEWAEPILDTCPWLESKDQRVGSMKSFRYWDLPHHGDRVLQRGKTCVEQKTLSREGGLRTPDCLRLRNRVSQVAEPLL